VRGLSERIYSIACFTVEKGVGNIFAGTLFLFLNTKKLFAVCNISSPRSPISCYDYKKGFYVLRYGVLTQPFHTALGQMGGMWA
jgi:hypothetical protein